MQRNENTNTKLSFASSSARNYTAAHTLRTSALQIGTRGLDKGILLSLSLTHRCERRDARCELQSGGGGGYVLFSMTPRLCIDPSIREQDCTVLNSAKAHPLPPPIPHPWRLKTPGIIGSFRDENDFSETRGNAILEDSVLSLSVSLPLILSFFITIFAT